MTRELLDWIKQQIPEDAQKNPASLVPGRIESILQRGGMPKDATDILAIQVALKQMGYNPGELDGVFKKRNALTSDTMKAIYDFQIKHNLNPDGQPGKLTLSKLLDTLALKVATQVVPGTIPEKKLPEVQIKIPVQIAPLEKSTLQQNIDGLKGVSSMLRWGSLFMPQSRENIRGAFNKPQDDLHHGKNAKTAILIPGFLCNQGVMRQLGTELSKSMNVVYPDIGANEQLINSLPELADKITKYVIDLENKGLLPKDGSYTIIGHSLGGSLALLVTNKLRAQHIIQVSSPNETPDIAKISGLGYIPALLNLRNIQSEYAKVQPISPIQRLTTVIPRDDKFVGTDVQGAHGIPGNFTIKKNDGRILKGGHIDPILTESGIKNIAEIANGIN